MTKLSDHFTLEELTITQVRSVSNIPSPEVIKILKLTAYMMEVVRSILNDKSILINSGYRSPGVNKIVGGSKKSAHMEGHAVDFICPGFGSPLKICRAIKSSDIEFDQLIEEGTWVHISFSPTMRRQVLTKKGNKYVVGLNQKEK